MLEFSGAKLVLLIGGRVATLLRDDRPDIPFPNMWDFPGGGREGQESPETCVLRETQEELAIVVSPEDLIWRKVLDNPSIPGTRSYWFAASLPAHRAQEITLGDEGQRWVLMHPDEWFADPQAIPHFKPRLRLALDALARHGIEIKGK
ncbi:NUDIX hydrolase [Aliiroseovarius sp. 2305UL8-7]|uniref:NUDIX hydrolase n=1 Tax=Aliiroseovarius conchicola TaxID=3121637 RepID=UPI0035272AAC